jgi:hypothetical protein
VIIESRIRGHSGNGINRFSGPRGLSRARRPVRPPPAGRPGPAAGYRAYRSVLPAPGSAIRRPVATTVRPNLVAAHKTNSERRLPAARPGRRHHLAANPAVAIVKIDFHCGSVISELLLPHARQAFSGEDVKSMVAGVLGQLHRRAVRCLRCRGGRCRLSTSTNARDSYRDEPII